MIKGSKYIYQLYQCSENITVNSKRDDNEQLEARINAKNKFFDLLESTRKKISRNRYVKK